ncbi:MAG: hypothetical protein O2856_18665, partial [Planctomycetota bacterium]|nr:hypothetical protein [Planctomycetota bacterium]
RDRNSPAPRLPTLARMVSPDAYTLNAIADRLVDILTELHWPHGTMGDDCQSLPRIPDQIDRSA